MFRLHRTILARAVPVLIALTSLQLAACESDDSPSGPGGGGTTNTEPVAEITAPAESASLWVDTYDDARKEWYIEVDFTSVAVDAEDGALDGSSVVWKAQASGGAMETLGSGRNLTARLYSLQPFATPYTIFLEATDSDGATVTSSVDVNVNILS